VHSNLSGVLTRRFARIIKKGAKRDELAHEYSKYLWHAVDGIDSCGSLHIGYRLDNASCSTSKPPAVVLDSRPGHRQPLARFGRGLRSGTGTGFDGTWSNKSKYSATPRGGTTARGGMEHNWIYFSIQLAGRY
jgi:hypothetical protein